MATIEQLARILTNRSGAVSDVVTRLQGTTNPVNINDVHIPSGITRTSNIVNLGDAAFPTLLAREGTGTNSVLRRNDLGNNFVVGADGAVSLGNIALTDVHTFANSTQRNAGFPVDGGSQTAPTVVWHPGDVAIVTEETTVMESTLTDTGFIYSAFVTATSFRVNGGWDNDANAPVSNLGFGVNDIIRFQIFGSTTFAGSTSGGTDFTVVSITQQSAGSSNAIVTVDRGTLPADVQPPIDTGSRIFASVSTSVTLPSGTYIYTGADQGTTAAATTNDDWTILTAPGGTASGADLPTFQLGTGVSTRLSDIDYNADTDTLSINGNAIVLAPRLRRGASEASVIVSNTATNISFQRSAFTVAEGGPSAAALPTTFVGDNITPQFYVEGLKVNESGVTLASNDTDVTINIPQAQLDVIRGRTVTIEWVYWRTV